jgi:16S rRNA C1402 (ribose-2'-O) methylase RsmI
VVRGEVTLLVAGAGETEPAPESLLEKALATALKQDSGSTADIAREVARRFDVPRKTVYALALKIRQSADPGEDETVT